MAPGHVELLGDLGQLGDAHVLERAELDDRRAGCPRPRRPPARAVRAARCRFARPVPRRSRCRSLATLAISSPQFIQSFAARRRNRQRRPFRTSVRVPSGCAPRSARDSLSIFVATTCRSTPRSSPTSAPPSMSDSSPGWRESTSRARARELRLAGSVGCRDAPPKYALGDHSQAPFSRPSAAAPRVAVSRQIDEVQRSIVRGRLASVERDAIDVGQPRLARRRAGARDLRPAQRVDQARLADVRSSGERDLRRGRRAGCTALVTNSAARTFNEPECRRFSPATRRPDLQVGRARSNR